MNRLNIDADAVSVGADRIYHVVADSARLEQLGSLFAVLLGIELEVDVMQQTDYAPVFLLVRIAEFFRVPAHNALDGQRVADMKRIFVVFFQKLKRFVPRDFTLSHFLSSPCQLCQKVSLI